MMKLFEKSEPQVPTPLDEEFEKYCKLYEEKFGKKANIPEPSGTKEFVIECIKKCLDENKDMLDDLYYPNFKKDMENGGKTIIMWKRLKLVPAINTSINQILK